MRLTRRPTINSLVPGPIVPPRATNVPVPGKDPSGKGQLIGPFTRMSVFSGLPTGIHNDPMAADE
jgi:hypothetical protein